MPLYLGLVHYPVYNKHGETIASAITTLDLHDLARLSATYGVKRFFVITPLEDQQELAQQVIRHWTEGYGASYNRDRREAMQGIAVVPSLEDAVAEIQAAEGEPPYWMATDAARQKGMEIGVRAARGLLKSGRTVFLLLGTAWGLHRLVLDRSDAVLEPVEGVGTYNHLSVRTAAAILLDRLVARR